MKLVPKNLIMKKEIVLVCFSLVTIAMCGQSNGNLEKAGTHLITNKEYRQFVYWVRDSIAYKLLGEQSEKYLISEDKNGIDIYPPLINWKTKIYWNGEFEREVLWRMHLPEHERFNRKKELDTRILIYNDTKIYPDTTCWIDTSIAITSYINLNLVKYYNWHPIFNDYPVQGITKEQINLFLKWKSIIYKKKYKLVNYDTSTSNIYKSLSGNVNTEFWKINNKKYKEFVFWVRDSIAHKKLGYHGIEKHHICENKYGEPIAPPLINWKEKIRWNEGEEREILLEMYLPLEENKLNVMQLDWKKINFEYYFIDYKAESKWRKELTNNIWQDRSLQIIKNEINVFPDSIEWQKKNTNIDFNTGFWNKKFDKERVAGITYEQAKAFYHWKILMNISKNINKKVSPVGEMVIPTKEQWEEVMSGKEIKPVHFDIPLSDKKYYYELMAP